MPKRSRQDLIEKLQEQMGFLRTSAAAYDQGTRAEATRLAGVLRTLLHDRGRSVSLLTQLGVKHQVAFMDTSLAPSPSPPGVIRLHTWDAGLVGIKLELPEPSFDPPLRNDHPTLRGLCPFRFWWRRIILRDTIGNRFTREDLVLFLAQKEGGVHVDPYLQRRFEALGRYNSLGWGWGVDEGKLYLGVPATPAERPMGNPIGPNVRQIADEVERTFEAHLGHLLAPQAASP